MKGVLVLCSRILVLYFLYFIVLHLTFLFDCPFVSVRFNSLLNRHVRYTDVFHFSMHLDGGFRGSLGVGGTKIKTGRKIAFVRSFQYLSYSCSGANGGCYPKFKGG